MSYIGQLRREIVVTVQLWSMAVALMARLPANLIWDTLPVTNR